VAGRDAQQLRGARRGGPDELLELPVELGDLGVERLDASRERTKRGLRGLRRSIKLAQAGPQAAAERRLAADRPALRELLAQFLRRGDDQLGELDHGRAACLDRAGARDAQQPDRFDDPVGLLGHGRRLAGEPQPSGHLGVDRVALAAPAPRVSVRLVDLDDRDAVLAQVARETGRIGAGRLDRDHVDPAESVQPRPAARRSR
jgi:hypothetical protein